MTAMPLAFSSTIEFSALPAVVREEVSLLDRHIKACAASRNRMVSYATSARQLTALGYKYSASGFRNLCRQYLKDECDWRTLVDWRKVPHNANRLPIAFITEVRRRWERHGNSCRQAYLDLLQDWRSGQPMPGYTISPRPDPLTGIPSGWSYANLMKVAKMDNFERVAMRIGLGKAKAAHGPKLFTTRAGLWPFSHLMFDDVDHDNFVHLGRQLCRVSELGCLDVLSASRFAWGAHPQLKRFDPKLGRDVTDKLKERQMRMLVAHVLLNFGFNPRGTTLVVERGTATIREDIIRLLHDRTNGVVQVDLGGWTGKKQIVAGMFQGKGGGNPRHKSPLESLHHLIHNRLGTLPAQTGGSLDLRPEQLDGILKSEEDLLKIAGQLSPWAAAQLEHLTLEYHSQFLKLLVEQHQIIDRRTWHELEGWEACGFVTARYRLDRELEQWISHEQYLALSDAKRQLLAEIVKADPACIRPQRLSPYEARQRGMNQVEKAPVGLVAELLYNDLAEPRQCRDGYFTFSDQTISPDTLRYHSRVRMLDGREVELRDRETYEVIVNPFDAGHLWVFSGQRGQGGFLGLAPRDQAPCRADADAKARQLGFLQRRYADKAAPLLARHADLARDEARRLKHNDAVLDGPRSPEEARVEEGRRSGPVDGDLSELIETSAPASAPQPEPPTTEGSLSDLI